MAHEKLIVGQKICRATMLATIMIFVTLTINGSAQERSPIRPEGSTLAEQYFAFANGLSVDAQYDSSNIYLNKAIAIYEAMSNQNDHTIASRHVACFRLFGRNLRKLGRYEKAQVYLKKALEIGLAKLGADDLEVARTYYEVGRCHYKVSEFDMAELFLSKALKVARELVKIGSNEKESYILAIIYNGLGSLYFRQGFNDKARQHYQMSLDLNLKRGREYELAVAGRYNNLGIVAESRGDYDHALEYYRKSINIKLRSVDRNPSITTQLGNIANAYSEKREYEQAIQIHQESLDIMLNAESSDSLDLAWTYGNLASVKFKLSRYDEALSDHNIALSILKKYFQGKNHYRIAGEYLEVAECYLGKSDFDKAMLYYHKSLNMSRAIFGDNHTSVARAYCGMGRTLEKRRDDETALNYYQSALKALSGGSETRHANLDSVSVEPIFLEVLERNGAVLRKLYAQNPGAIDYLERSLFACQLAIQMVDRMRRGFKNDGSKLFLGEQFAGIYENAIRSALKLFDISKEKRYCELAFSFAQKNKANLLLEKLYESEAKQFSSIPLSLLAREDSLKARLTYYDTEIKSGQSRAGQQDAAKLRKLKEAYFSLKSEFNALRDQFESDYPKYYQLKYQTQAVSVQQVQDALDEDTGFLEYAVTDSNVFIFAVSKDEFHVHSVAIDSTFSMHVNGMLTGIRQRNYARYVAHAHPVYRTLVQPLESWLAHKNRLIIVPDGLVSSIPFEALLTRDVSQSKSKQDYRTLPYLNKKFTLSYGYSTTLLFETFNNQGAQEPTLDYLAFAPAFANGFSRGSKATLALKSGEENSDPGVRDISLPAARDEVFAIKNMFHKSYGGVEWVRSRLFGQLTRVYVGDAATEEKLKSSELNQSRYIHFATHGVVNKKLPSLSGLVFGHETETEDGVLYLGEIYNLKLNADLAVLSACETATGKWVEGEGLISFARGFLYAGARNLLVSLWKVSDSSTYSVMIEFYRGLLNGKSMAIALKDAKDKMIASEYDFAMPYYWASFVLIGR